MTKNKDNIYSLSNLIVNQALINLTQEVNNLRNKHTEICEMAVRSVLHALDYKDHYTYGHSMRVAHYSLILGDELNMNEHELYDLEMSAICHDIGKIGIPDSILNKPARLTDKEFIEMKTHPVKSFNILKDFSPFKQIAIDAKFHHERYDGKGYPDGLSGTDIPFASRIILIADTFDAMTSSRPYREGLSYDIAFDELVKFSGSQFDPILVAHFLKGMAKENSRNSNTFYLKIINEKFNKKAA